MSPSQPRPTAAFISIGVAAIAGFALAVGGRLALAAAAAVAGAILARLLAELRPRGVEDPSRRRFLTAIGLGGVVIATAGVGAGEAIRRLTRPSPTRVVDEMATSIGAQYMDFMRRGYYPGRSGELQLVLSPWGTSNYPAESTSLVPRDPRSAHASVWNYLQRVPIVVYAPGLVKQPQDPTDEVTLADIAPTIATLIGSKDFHAPDGNPLPGIDTPKVPPKVVVTFVIDGGGWNVLKQWPNAWPNLASLMRAGATYRNAFMGSFPAVTACAHATIGTGAFPRNHGISGHFIRQGEGVVKAYGAEGLANTSTILVPTVAEVWSEETGDQAWIGEIGYQIWHVGMIGRGGDRPLGRLPVGVYFQDKVDDWAWASQNPYYYRLPDSVPSTDTLIPAVAAYDANPATPGQIFAEFTPGTGNKAYPCCSPPVVEHQGLVIGEAFASEPIGEGAKTSLLFINFKTPDYTGHVYNMLAPEEEVALKAVDAELGKLRANLESRFKPGEFALIVCADHGQCPLPDVAGGVRLDPIQLAGDIQTLFPEPRGPGVVQSVRPSEIYLDRSVLWNSGVSQADIAAALRDYTYGENYHVYGGSSRLSFEKQSYRQHSSPAAVQSNQTGHREFAAVLPGDFIVSLGTGPIRRFGPGDYPGADIGIQPLP